MWIKFSSIYPLFFLVFFLIPLASAEVNGDYHIVVDEDGKALIFLLLEGNGTINLPLPLDVEEIEVDGALTFDAENGLDVVVSDDETASLIYKTDLLTVEKDGEVEMEMTLPELDSISILVSLPPEAQIKAVKPKASVTPSPQSVNILWTFTYPSPKTFKIGYSLPPETSQPLSTTSTSLTSSSSTTSFPPSKISHLPKSYVMFMLLIFVVFGGVAYLTFKRLFSSKVIRPTAGQERIMKTLTGNEYKIVEILIQHGGGMKRNQLEKISNLSKSSLAGALFNLERRGILIVDKSNVVHYVELSDWFKAQ